MSKHQTLLVGFLGILLAGIMQPALAQLDRSGIDFSGSRLDGSDVRNTGLNGVGFGNFKNPGLNNSTNTAPTILIQKAKDIDPPAEPDVEAPPQEEPDATNPLQY